MLEGAIERSLWYEVLWQLVWVTTTSFEEENLKSRLHLRRPRVDHSRTELGCRKESPGSRTGKQVA